MREWAKGVVKKVTLELIYEVVNERSKDIYEKLERIEGKIDKLDVQRQEDFRYLNQKIDTQIGQLRQEIKEENGQLRQEIGQLRQEMDRINQRLDTIMQVLMDIVRK